MPVVPTVSGRQVESRGVQSAGLQTFSQPGIGDAFVRAGTEAIDVLGQAKQRANIALAQEASLNLSQISSDLLNNPETGLLNLKGKNAIGKGHEYTQQFDAQVEQLAMSLPDEQARNAFMQQAQQQRIQFTTQAGRHEIGQINAYEEGQFQATLLNNGKNAAALYGDNAAYVLANKQTFQQIEEYGAAHGWSDEQIQAKKIEFKEKVADAALSQWSANNATAFIQSNGELSDTAAGARRAVTDSGSSERVRGIRNNNPGNLEYSKTNPWVGQTGDDGRFAKFETPEHGIRALGRNLMSYQRQGIDTVSEIINRWAPPTDKNDTMSYIKAVCEQLGVSADEPLDASNPDTLKALCAAIIHHENGSQPYSDQQLTAGVSAALGLSTIPTNTKRYTGNAAFDAASPEAQASFMRQADQLRRQQQAEYKTMIDSQVRDATAAYMRGVEFPNPPGEADFIAAYGVREGNLRYTEFRNTQIAGQYIGSFRNMPTSSITAYVEQLRPDIAYAAGTNIAFGMAQRGLTAKTLRDGGYSEMANQYDVLDRQAIAIDAVLGVAFGGVGRFINSRGESTSAPNFSPVDVDAALAANAAHHAEIDIAPGVPINVLSRNSHIQALRKAMSDVSQGIPVDVASIVESASFSEIPGRKSLLSQAVNEALSSVDDGVTARAIENRLLEEQAAQLLPRGDRQVYQSEIANSQRIIENLTEQRAQILAEEPTGSGKALSRARSDKQARLRDIDQRIRQAQERLEFSRNALAPHEPGGQFFEARAELARRQQAESELNAQAVSFYKTAEVRTPDEVAPFEPGKILQQTEQKMMADPAGDIDLRIAEDSLLESPDMIITVLDDDGNPQSRSAREVLDEANRESEQAIQDSSLFDVAVACFLRG